MYEKLEKILDLLWKNDDQMEQDTLFQLQEDVADLLLEVAYKEGKQNKCLKKYSWIYRSWYTWDESDVKGDE